jgi:hypothetical protein
MLTHTPGFFILGALLQNLVLSHKCSQKMGHPVNKHHFTSS